MMKARDKIQLRIAEDDLVTYFEFFTLTFIKGM